MEQSDWINLGLLVVAVIAAIISILAIVDSRRSRRDSEDAATRSQASAEQASEALDGIRGELASKADTERMLRRSEFARDLIVWFDRSTPVMVVGADVAVLDKEWVRDGEALSARARVIDSAGAVSLLVAARDARTAVEKIPLERRLDAAIRATQLLKLYAERWVEEPGEKTYAITSWIEEDDEYAT
ncbi:MULTISPECIES: hypothetical protein [unclassified Microbacterium]|uniref:hypothetical protein n=1 Tax=unclassified Microbacterium TaxID=2609290 RepID=UPI003019753C